MKIDHVGLTVEDVDASAAFFVECLGWTVVRRRPSYPAIYLRNGDAVATLWQVANPGDYVAFDRHRNIGLHHLAFSVDSREALDEVHRRASDWPGVIVEFDPEFSGPGPKVHSMIREPGGCRIELAWDPR